MPKSTELLASILDALNMPCPDTGLAALRMWGQTGDRPSGWIAAAEPVYLEPRLDHLCLHSQAPDNVPTTDFRPLFDHLQRSLAQGSDLGFARIGSCGYVSTGDPMATASFPAYVIDQQKPDEFMPSGDNAASYRNLISEIEMALHDHEVNLLRQAIGQSPINSLWLWGGGVAAEQQTRPHPPLFSDDPLLKGYWYSNTGAVEPWPGINRLGENGADGISRCLEASVAGFVAVVPESPNDAENLHGCLRELRRALRAGRVSRLTLMFRDGVKVDVVDEDRLCLWRKNSPLLQTASQ